MDKFNWMNLFRTFDCDSHGQTIPKLLEFLDIDFVLYPSRGTFSEVTTLRGAKSLYATLTVDLDQTFESDQKNIFRQN